MSSASGDFVFPRPPTAFVTRFAPGPTDTLFRGAPKILKLYSGPIQSLNGIPSQPAGNSAWAVRQRAIYSPYQANIGLLNKSVVYQTRFQELCVDSRNYGSIQPSPDLVPEL